MNRRLSAAALLTLALAASLLVACADDPRLAALEARAVQAEAQLAELRQGVEPILIRVSEPTPTPEPIPTHTPTVTPKPTVTPTATPTPLPTPTPTEDDRLRALIKPHWEPITRLVESAPRLVDLAGHAAASRELDHTLVLYQKTVADRALAALADVWYPWRLTWEELPRLRMLRNLIDKAEELNTELLLLSINFLDPCKAQICPRIRPVVKAHALVRELQNLHQDLRVFLGAP
ncbi:MAG: hypothetical protein FJX77_13795 [Armatimonadetes bacterium]|nr:hypothetical protein [Armatimonadota bacterium]